MTKVYIPEQRPIDEQVFINNTASSLEDNITVAQAKVLNTVVTTDSAAVQSQLNLTFNTTFYPTVSSLFVQYENQVMEELSVIAANTDLVLGSQEFYDDINAMANDMLSRYPVFNLNWYRMLDERRSLQEGNVEEGQPVETILVFLIRAIERQVELTSRKSNSVPINTTDILRDKVSIEGTDIIRQVVDESALGETANAVSVEQVTEGLNIAQRNYIYSELLLKTLQEVPRGYFYNTFNPTRIKLNRTADFRNYFNNTSTFDDFVKSFLKNFGKPVPAAITIISVTNIFSSVIKLNGTIAIRDLSNRLDSFLLSNNLIRL